MKLKYHQKQIKTVTVLKIINYLLLFLVFSILSCKNNDSKNESLSSLNLIQKSKENSNEEISSLVEVVLNFNKVKNFIHYEKDSIFYIYNNSILINYQINFDSNKHILINEVRENMNYIEFTSIQKERNDTYLISFNIPKQGVVGNVTLKKNNNKWYIYKDNIYEH